MQSFIEKYRYHIVSIMSFTIVALFHFFFIGPITMLGIAIFTNVDFNRSLVDSYVSLVKLNVKFTALAINIIAWLYSIFVMMRIFYRRFI